MTFEINKKENKTGKRSVYFVTVNGKRISGTNFIKKWEAVEEFKFLLKKIGEDKLMAWAAK